jgi:hypothetical protein
LNLPLTTIEEESEKHLDEEGEKKNNKKSLYYGMHNSL